MAQKTACQAFHKPCNLKDCQAIRRCSVPHPKRRAVTLHTYAHGRKTHATVLDAPHTPSYCSYGALTYSSRWHSLGPVLAQALTTNNTRQKGEGGVGHAIQAKGEERGNNAPQAGSKHTNSRLKQNGTKDCMPGIRCRQRATNRDCFVVGTWQLLRALL